MPKKQTHEEFVNKLKKKNPNVKILGEYINARTKIKVECLIDNYIWYSTPDNLLRGYGCPKCAGKCRTTKSFCEELKNINPDIEILGEYKRNDSKIKCLCKKHDYLFYSTPSHLLNGQGCKYCKAEKVGDFKRLTQKEFSNKFYKINKSIEVVGKYIDSHTKILVRCKECGREWCVIPNNALTRGIICTCNGKENISKGELYIFNELKKHNINFIYQYSFENLFGVNGHLLSYDFYLPNYNLLIEFQGAQHEHPVEYFGGEEQFEIQKEHDRRKREYAKSHNIKLLEIWYWDFNNIKTLIIEALHLKAS